jgi:hypothetical protein
LGKASKPPVAMKELREKKARSKPKQLPGWQDVSMTEHAPEYKVSEDRFASGYLAGLKRHGRLKPFLNLVYEK